MSFSLSRRWFDDDEEEDDVDDEDDVVDAAADVMLTRWGPGVKRGERRGLENESGAVNGAEGGGPPPAPSDPPPLSPLVELLLVIG